MNVENSLKGMLAWSVKALEEIEGNGLPSVVIRYMKNINSEGRKVEYRGAGLKGIQKKIDEANKFIKRLEHIHSGGDYNRTFVEDAVKRSSAFLDLVTRHVSSSRAAAQQIIGMMEKMKENSKMNFNVPKKYVASLIKSLTNALNNLESVHLDVLDEKISDAKKYWKIK